MRNANWPNSGADYLVEGAFLYKWSTKWTYVSSIEMVKTDSTIEMGIDLSKLGLSTPNEIKVAFSNTTEALPIIGSKMVTTELVISGLNTVPIIPNNIVFITSGSAITLTWNPVYSATGYDVEADGVVIDNGLKTTYVNTGLQAGDNHVFRIRAKNETGTGDWSSKVNIITLLAVPKNLTTRTTATSITLTWNAVDGSTGYDVEADGVVIDNGVNTTYTNTGLQPGTNHVYRVRARNAAGTGEWSTNISTITLPAVPVNVIATATTNSITLTWDAVDGASGYDVEADGVVIDNGVNTTYTNTGLQPGTNHVYRVRARNAAGTGEWSTNISTITLPAVPVNVITTATTNNITLTWNAVDGASGSSELPLFWEAFDDAGPIHGTALKVLLLTGQRPGEVTHMRSEHVVDGWWTLPGKPVPELDWPGTKNGETHKVWLPVAAQSLLEELGTEGKLFAGDQGKTIRLPDTMSSICERLGGEKATPHDLRRTPALGSRLLAIPETL